MKPRHILTKNLLAVSHDYFEREVLPSLEATARIVPAQIKTYRIAGKKICVHFYGKNVLRTCSRALAHNELPSDQKVVDLTIHVWDSSPTGRDMPPPTTTSHTDGFFGVYIGGEESLNFYDPVTHTAYFWTYDALQLPDWILGAPFRTIFHWFLNESRIHLIHGAVVGQGDTSVLLTAKSGSGKSTTALSCVLSGMNYLADDYIAIETSETIRAHSLYQSAKITREGLDLFPEFKKSVWNKNFGEREKAVLFLSDIVPQQVKTTSNLVAILIPRIKGGETKIVKARKIEAMLAIAPTTLLQLPLAETNKVHAFKDILGKLPCYFLDLDSEIRQVPQVIETFIQEHKTL